MKISLNNKVKLIPVRLIMTCVFACMLNSSSIAQTVNSTFECITIKDGLSQSTVNHIIQDKNGFLWFATFGGLNKYDGYSFTVFRHDKDDPTSIANDGCNFIMEDNEGYIWIVPNGETGLDRFNPKTEKFENFMHDPNDESSISSNVIRNFNQDNEGNVWICTDKGLNLVVSKMENGKQVTAFKKIITAEKSDFNYVYETMNNELLLFADTLYYLDRKTNMLIKTEVDLESSSVISIAEDKAGNLYLGTSQTGLLKLRYNLGSSSYEKVDPEFLNVTPSTRNYLYIDSKNNLWIGTETKGIYQYNLDREQLVNFIPDKLDNKSLSDNTIYSFFEDHSGILWIGTFSQGLCKYNLYGKEFDHFRSIPGKANSLSGDVISSISSIKSDELWVGLDLDGGVNRIIFKDNREPDYIHYKNIPGDPNSIAANNTLSLVQRKNGDVWLGSAGGTVTRITPEIPGSGKKPVIKNYRFDLWTFSIFEDSEGTLWGGTWQGGFWRYNDEKDEFIKYMHNPDDPTSIGVDVIWAIGEDKYKNIWIGGNRKGLSILPASEKNIANPKFINFSFNTQDTLGLSNNTVNAFCFDKDGTMWIGTGGGLNKVIDNDNFMQNPLGDGKLTFKSFHDKDGLPSETIVGIVEDKEGNLWMSTLNGVSKFNPADTTFSNYFESDGLQSNEFWHNSFFINPDGRVFFGGQNGFNTFYPKDIIDNPFEPIMIFTDLKLFNKSIKVKDVVNKDTILDLPISNTKSLNLSYKNNVLSFEFAALHYTYPAKNIYRYYLEGFDEGWSNIGNQRSVTFTNLNPGKYVLHINGTNNDGRWSSETASIALRIRPPWWRTIVAYIFEFLLLVALILIFIRWREKKLQEDKKNLEAKLQKGLEEIEKSKEEVAMHSKELEKRDIAERVQKWQNKGMILIGDEIIKHKKDPQELSKHFLQALVKYLEVHQGALYILEDNDKDNSYLELSAGYGLPKSKLKEKQILIGESLVGACFKDNEKKIIDDIPEGYTSISTGLGSVVPKHLLLVPLKNEDVTIGILEIATKDKLDDYQIEFVEKISETFTYNMFATKTNQRMEQLLEQSRQQAEEMKSQEEELRQNMEEMTATQEESERINDENRKKEEELQRQISELKEIQIKYKILEKKCKELENKNKTKKS